MHAVVPATHTPLFHENHGQHPTLQGQNLEANLGTSISLEALTSHQAQSSFPPRGLQNSSFFHLYQHHLPSVLTWTVTLVPSHWALHAASFQFLVPNQVTTCLKCFSGDSFLGYRSWSMYQPIWPSMIGPYLALPPHHSLSPSSLQPSFILSPPTSGPLHVLLLLYGGLFFLLPSFVNLATIVLLPQASPP